MYKLLYIAPPPIDISHLDGVAKKIMSQVKAFALRFHVKLIYRCEHDIFLYDIKNNKKIKIGSGKNKNDILRLAKQLVKGEHFDFSYIRYPNSDYFFLSLLRKMRNNKICTVVEIPTYPYEKEGNNNLRANIIRLFDYIFRKQLYKFVDRIVTYSDDNEIFGIPTIKTINGYDFDAVPFCQVENKRAIHFCAVSSMYQLHGYDRLIKGINDYYKNGGNKEIVFDVVGCGDMDHIWHSLVEHYDLSGQVIFHGKLYGSELDDIYRLASIGVNSLGIHRQNLLKESTLKTREYAAWGLPILSSSNVDAFDSDGNSEYVFRIPADDSGVDVKSVIDSYENLVNKLGFQKMRKDIRFNAENVCSMKKTLEPVVTFFEENIQ